jgi:hypothetical protein
MNRILHARVLVKGPFKVASASKLMSSRMRHRMSCTVSTRSFRELNVERRNKIKYLFLLLALAMPMQSISWSLFLRCDMLSPDLYVAVNCHYS